MKRKHGETYKKAGVDLAKEDLAVSRLFSILRETFHLRKSVGRCLTEFGHFAAVIEVNNIGIAMKTDGVGTKVFIAQLMDKYDTIGIDCVAMNVNDIICTGAEPLSFMDYIAIQDPDPHIIEEIGKGLKKGAEMARVNIVGGETALLKEMIRGMRRNCGFDLVGMAIGIVQPDKIIDGTHLKEGDVLLGIKSSGIHSNGLTLARKVLLKKMRFNLNDYFEELGRTLGEELLEPTYIYVPEVLEMLNSNLNIKMLAHITSRGFLNLLRTGRNYGFEIVSLPEPQPIFQLIQKYGNISNEEMYHTFNMGIGFCIVLDKSDVDEALQIIEKHNKKAFTLGYAVRDPERRIKVKPLNMVEQVAF
jgi:phosphoribosylformylglycinamidine cyclo-ligase